jgi:hypothetical protein
MKIIDKIQAVFLTLRDDPDGEGALLGEKLQEFGCAAVADGINPLDKDSNWRKYMKLFASNPAQLRRLNGEDAAFNDSLWGKKTLAYLVANGCCGSETTAATGINCFAAAPAIGTARHMSPEMIASLDSELDDSDDPAFAD